MVSDFKIKSASCLIPVLAMASTFGVAVSPTQAEFQRLEIDAIAPCSVPLSRLEGVAYQCWSLRDRNAKLPVWQHALAFSFGTLSQTDWEKIAKTYAWNPDSLAPYNPEQHYWLIDFLPPLMQAFNLHRFQSEAWVRSDQHSKWPESLNVVANCWGTVSEILRLNNASTPENAYLSMIPPEEMLTVLEAVSTPVSEPEPGDILLISHHHGDRTYLDHLVILLDEHLVFEKAGAGDAVPYRLIDMDTIRQIWRPDVFDYQVRRVTKSLPHPHAFAHGGSDFDHPWTLIQDLDPRNPSRQSYAIVPLPPLQKVQGRSHLPKTVYEKGYFQKAWESQNGKATMHP